MKSKMFYSAFLKEKKQVEEVKQAKSSRFRAGMLFIALVLNGLSIPLANAQGVKVGLNYPMSGPYWWQGVQQAGAAKIAVEEINAAGGILGQRVELVERNSESDPGVTTRNVKELIDKEGVRMVFGGASSAVAIAAGKVCEQKDIPFFGTLTYSTTTTGTEGRRHVFRETYNAWMAAKALAPYLATNFPSKDNRYFFITADYTWGHTTEASLRQQTDTMDKGKHNSVRTPFPGGNLVDFLVALSEAKAQRPDVLVLVLFGDDMVTALQQAEKMGLKESTRIVVPSMTLGMAKGAGPEAMEGVISSAPWTWNVPYQFSYPKGKDFVDKYTTRYGGYPSSSAASVYTILYEYKSAVERAGSFDTAAVIKALEGHSYTLLKDEQTWRDFDHQSVQTVYAIRGKRAAEVKRDKYVEDYFEIIGSLPGEAAVRTREEWNAVREAAGKPTQL